MLVFTTIEITKGFQVWKDMVKESGERITMATVEAALLKIREN